MSAEEPTKKRPWPGCLVVVAAVVFVGLFTLVSTLSPYFKARDIHDGDSMSSLLNNGRQLLLSVRIFALDHEGKFPHTLLELVNDGILEQSTLDKLLSHRLEQSRKPLGWIYIPDLTDEIVGDYPVLISPVLQDKSWAITQKIKSYVGQSSRYPLTPKRLVVFSNSDTEYMDESDFQVLLKRHSITLPASATADTAGK